MTRVALVTGGTRGIGHAISIALKYKGCRVAANYGGNDTAARQFQAETGIPVYRFDVGDFAACQEGVTRITRDLGPIDILVNNAGITRDAMLHRMSKAVAQESAARGITVNVIAPGYIATEMVQAVPKEILDSKILPFIPVGRLGTVEEVARCVTFLADDAAGFITGACLDANGGQYMA